jgi:hypothetical protein
VHRSIDRSYFLQRKQFFVIASNTLFFRLVPCHCALGLTEPVACITYGGNVRTKRLASALCTMIANHFLNNWSRNHRVHRMWSAKKWTLERHIMNIVRRSVNFWNEGVWATVLVAKTPLYCIFPLTAHANNILSYPAETRLHDGVQREKDEKKLATHIATILLTSYLRISVTRIWNRVAVQ